MYVHVYGTFLGQNQLANADTISPDQVPLLPLPPPPPLLQDHCDADRSPQAPPHDGH